MAIVSGVLGMGSDGTANNSNGVVVGLSFSPFLAFVGWVLSVKGEVQFIEPHRNKLGEETTNRKRIMVAHFMQCVDTQILKNPVDFLLFLPCPIMLINQVISSFPPTG